jgi:hypothetical protein
MSQPKKTVYYYITNSDYLVSIPGKASMVKLSRKFYKGSDQIKKEIERLLKEEIELRFQSNR